MHGCFGNSVVQMSTEYSYQRRTRCEMNTKHSKEKAGQQWAIGDTYLADHQPPVLGAKICMASS
jgi:hypothetical protein